MNRERVALLHIKDMILKYNGNDYFNQEDKVSAILEYINRTLFVERNQSHHLKKNKEDILKLVREGKDTTYIADKYGVTYQAIYYYSRKKT